MKLVATVALVLLIVAGFAGFVATHAVHANVVAQGYFADAIAHDRVLDRLYDQLLVDPSFAPELDRLLGGAKVPRDQAIATVKHLVPPAQVEAMSREVSAQLAAHFRDDAPLDLSFDITPIIDAVRGQGATDPWASSPYVAHDRGRYRLGPGADVTAAIDARLAIVRRLNDAAAWASVAAGIAVALAVILIVIVHRRRPRAIAGWLGVAFAAAGLATAAGWLLVARATEAHLDELAARGKLPPSFRAIVHDVLDSTVSGLGGAIWIPSIGALLLGAALIGTAIRMRPRVDPATVAA